MRLTPLLRLSRTTPVLESLTLPAAPRPAPSASLGYLVSRTRSDSIPVYLQRKAGGTRKTTQIRRVEGDPVKLRDELRSELGPALKVPAEDITVSPASGHVIVKGFHMDKIKEFLTKKGF